MGGSTDARRMAGDAETAVEDLCRLLNHLDIEKAHLVGQSMGGWVVAGFALRYAERTRSLVLADTYGGLSTEAMREWVTAERWTELRERAAENGRDFDIMDPARAFRTGRSVASRRPATRLTSSDPTPGTARCSNISVVDCVSPSVPQRACKASRSRLESAVRH